MTGWISGGYGLDTQCPLSERPSGLTPASQPHSLVFSAKWNTVDLPRFLSLRGLGSSANGTEETSGGGNPPGSPAPPDQIVSQKQKSSSAPAWPGCLSSLGERQISSCPNPKAAALTSSHSHGSSFSTERIPPAGPLPLPGRTLQAVGTCV